VTDLSQRAAPQPGEPLPQRSEALPQRRAPLPQRGRELPQRRPTYEPIADAGRELPSRSETLPQRGGELPQRGGELPQRGGELPQRGGELPQRGGELPQRGGELPQRGGELPQRGGELPQRGGELPQPGEAGYRAEPLPRRTSRTRPSGRHRSPHRLSVASDAPALVLAVPGTAEADTTGIGAAVAAIAGLSCPGVDIRVGYLDGETQSVSECLPPPEPGPAGQNEFPDVIVPLLLSPSPHVDAALRQLAGQPAIPALVAAHLGPHPLVAAALHSRLAEAGLARHARSTGLSISAEGRGVVVLADVGEQAADAAAVAAVLLASRLSVPVMPASLGDPASIVDAVNRLTESGALRPVLAPCLIGLEISPTVLDDLSVALGAPCALPLGAHQAVGQLVAIRYGAALAGLSLAG
jgi:hypothetical protein